MYTLIEKNVSTGEVVEREMTPEEIATLPPPSAPAPQRWTWLQFIERFTEAEQLAIVTASMQSAPIKLWYDKAVGAEYIQADEPRTVAGMQALVDAGLITAARRDEILGA